MTDGVRFGHTNLIARDWRGLARFYTKLFGCTLGARNKECSPC